MKALLLYSGGKDSSLVAYLLQILGYDATLVTANFGVVKNSWKTAAQAAKILRMRHEVLKLPKEMAINAADIAEKDNFALDAINFIHRQTLEAMCKKYSKKFPLIADGTRRDDKTPKLKHNEMQSLEDRYKVEYSPILHGLSYKTINYLTSAIFKFETIYTGAKPTSEYETEIRALLRERKKGLDKKIFPKGHNHTLITGIRLPAKASSQ